MGIDLLINLNLADITPHPVILPYERIEELGRAAVAPLVIAVWCEAHPGIRLYDRIVASRPMAREIKRPLGIFTGTPQWDLSITGVVDNQDQFWMYCRRDGRPLNVLRDLYESELAFCPLGHVVLVVDPLELDEDADELAHLRACRDIARAHPEVIGLVWLGSSVIDDLPGPPRVVELVPPPPGWGQGGPTPSR